MENKAAAGKKAELEIGKLLSGEMGPFSDVSPLKLSLGLLGILVGFGLIWLQDQHKSIYDIFPMLLLNKKAVLGALLLFASTFLLAPKFLETLFHRTTRFIDIDNRNRADLEKDIVIRQLNSEIQALWQGKKNKGEDTRGGRGAAREPKIMSFSQNEMAVVESFKHYFLDIKMKLEQKAAAADEKASILLDQGVSYSTYGIYFYLLSIVSWQLVFWFHGYRTEHLYGIACCSLLFIFIEFLSAWFLRQYRHFVDTSTYMMKIKGIFDRYMLSLMALKEHGPENAELQAKLLETLSAEIRWPDDYLLKKADISFTREMLQSFTSFAAAMNKSKNKAE